MFKKQWVNKIVWQHSNRHRSLQISILFYRISLLILLCFHLPGRYAARQVAEWKAILFFGDSDPNYLHLYKTVGFQLLQNYFRSSTNSSITASSCTKAAMASHTFLVNGQQKNPHNPATENMLFCTVLFSAAVSGSDYAFPARVKMLKSFAAQFSIPSECIWR